MTSSLNLDPKTSKPPAPPLGLVPPGVFDFESVAPASRGPVDPKRSFASVLGHAKKDAPSETRSPRSETSLRRPVLSNKVQPPAPHPALAVKPKFKDQPQAAAADQRMRPAPDSSGETPRGEKEESPPAQDPDSQGVESEPKNQDEGVPDPTAPGAAPLLLPVKEFAPVAFVTSGCAIDPTAEEKPSDLVVADAPLAAVGAGTTSGKAARDLAQLTQAAQAQAVSTQAQAVSPQAQAEADQDFELKLETAASAAADPVTSGVGEQVTAQKNAAKPFDPLAGTTGLIVAERVEKNAAGKVNPMAEEAKIAPSGIFNNIENTGNNNFKIVEPVVGLSTAQAGPAMASTLFDLSEASRPEVSASEAVARVNLVQVVNEVAALSEKMRVSGQHRCVVDFDVAGHGSLRVEVVRRDDQFKTVFSTDSLALRESLQAAFDRSDRPSQMSSSFDWQGSSSDTPRQGQNGAQADADSRQTTYFKSEASSRSPRLTAVPAVSPESNEAPVLSPNHRLQLFA